MLISPHHAAELPGSDIVGRLVLEPNPARFEDVRGPMLGEASCYAFAAFLALVRAVQCADLAGFEVDGSVVEAVGEVAAALTAADAYGHHEVAQRFTRGTS